MTRGYRFISEHRAVFGVTRLCRVVLGVRRPGFYEWLAAAPTRAERAKADERLATEIGEVHAGHRGAYGRPRIVVELRRRGCRVNHKRVGRIMRERGVAGLRDFTPDVGHGGYAAGVSVAGVGMSVFS